MPFPNPETQFQPGESGNPAGKPKGTKHLSTHIQEMLNDEKFELKLKSGEIIKQRPITQILSLVNEARAEELERLLETPGVTVGNGTKLTITIHESKIRDRLSKLREEK